MSTKPRKTPSTQTKASTPSRLSASTAEVIPVELSAETFERGPLPARIQGRVINPQHKLKITSLHDAQASCSCGWSLVHTGKLTRAEIRAKWWSHKRAVAALTFCIIPGCTGTKLEGRKYCAAHQERANGQTLQEKVTEQRACQHATRAEERVCEAEQEAIANADVDGTPDEINATIERMNKTDAALESTCAGCGNTPQACDCNTLNTDTITTILAALRLFQREFDGCSAGKVAEVFPDHFTEGMQSVSPRPLMSEEIDALCQAINTSGLKYHRLLHISDFTCSQCDFTAYAMVDMSAHWTATGHSGCRADIINPAKAEPSKTWTPPNATAFLTLRPEQGSITASCGCLMEPAGDDPDPDAVAFYMCEMHERAEATKRTLAKVYAEVKSWHSVHGHSSNSVQCDSLCALMPEMEDATR